MSIFASIFETPEVVEHQLTTDWLNTAADYFLNRIHIQTIRESFQIVEMEVYYNEPLHHPDPFLHGHPIQQTWGQWYFHRSRTTYKGGTFKGLDCTFGHAGAYGGILIRSLKTEKNEWIDGPCLCVERLLQSTGFEHVAHLDQAISDRAIWDTSSPLYIMESNANRTQMLYPSMRVGLTLKRLSEYPTMPYYIGQPYRFLTEPRQIKKGRTQLILQLHRIGMSKDEIHACTGSPIQSIDRKIHAFEAGVLEGYTASAVQPLNSSRHLSYLYGLCTTSSSSDLHINTPDIHSKV